MGRIDTMDKEGTTMKKEGYVYSVCMHDKCRTCAGRMHETVATVLFAFACDSEVVVCRLGHAVLIRYVYIMQTVSRYATRCCVLIV